MADISTEISNFQNAVYGEEVRGSMISLAEKLNDVCEDCESTVGTMEAGYDAAIEAAGTATSAANTAASSANGAASSATSAASSANSAASAATSAANNATSKASAADALNTSVQQAEAARVSAESARASAEAARVTAETARAGSEANRQSAESTRSENETARNSAEISRVSAEAQRNANEANRQSAESSRVSAESSRATAFTQMQNAFDDMSQQVLPPATTSTLGGVIVGTGLSVANDGTLSFEAGDYETSEHAAATYATITTVSGKADAQHVHAATDITSGTLSAARGGTGVTTAAAERERLGLGSTTGALPIANGGTGATTASGALSAILDSSPLPVANGGTGLSTTASGAFYSTSSGGTPSYGTLPVAQGGTGATTLTANGILQGDGTSAVSAISTASGALYATAADGAASFGTLPIAQGGTGSTTAADALAALGAVSSAGGTLTGGFTIENDNMDVGYNQTISADATNGIKTVDQNSKTAAQVVFKETADGTKQLQIQAHGYNSSNADVWNSLAVNVSKDGTRSYTLTDPAAFCSTLHVGDSESVNQQTAVTCANSSWVDICSLSLSAGTWCLFSSARFADNATGIRTTTLSTGSGNPTNAERRHAGESVNACTGSFPTYVSISRLWELSSTTTVKVKAYQNSGGNLGCDATLLAVRIK